MISVRRCHPNSLQKKRPVLIRPLVLKLPIDFHCGRLWGSDLLWFLAPTKAKLSHLEAGSVFRDSGSALTPPANLFPSGGTFVWSSRISPQWTWRSERTISYFLPSDSTEFVPDLFASLQINTRHKTLTKLQHFNKPPSSFLLFRKLQRKLWPAESLPLKLTAVRQICQHSAAAEMLWLADMTNNEECKTAISDNNATCSQRRNAHANPTRLPRATYLEWHLSEWGFRRWRQLLISSWRTCWCSFQTKIIK